jgi:hypothetical protein
MVPIFGTLKVSRFPPCRWSPLSCPLEHALHGLLDLLHGLVDDVVLPDIHLSESARALAAGVGLTLSDEDCVGGDARLTSPSLMAPEEPG